MYVPINFSILPSTYLVGTGEAPAEAAKTTNPAFACASWLASPQEGHARAHGRRDVELAIAEVDSDGRTTDAETKVGTIQDSEEISVIAHEKGRENETGTNGEVEMATAAATDTETEQQETEMLAAIEMVLPEVRTDCDRLGETLETRESSTMPGKRIRTSPAPQTQPQPQPLQPLQPELARK